MFNALADAMAFFYDLWPSYGGAIVLFTIAIMAILSPLSIKSTRSMIRMQRVQPELKKLQQQYKGDREALNREMMAFYQANNINPFSSCLPLLIQMPVFIVLFNVLNGLTKSGEDGNFDPKYLDPESALYKALSQTNEMVSWGMDLSKSALTELRDEGLLVALPFFVLVVLVAATQWYQQRQISGRRDPSVPINPQQQMMTKVLPFIIVPFAISFPAGLVVYYVTSNVCRIGQQALITRLERGSGGASGMEIVVPPPSTPSKGGNGKKPASTTPKPITTGRVTNPGSAQRRKKRK